MPYEYLEDGVTSDVTFHAWGATLDELFSAAADATTNVMIATLDTVRPRISKPVSVSADTLDLLLLRLLDELIFYKDAEGLILRATNVHVETVDHAHQARADLRGEPIDRNAHELSGDVKAVTLHGLRVEQHDAGWHAEVTLDV
ncbi:MAG TPA: archease [Candidatus Binatia bacterium]|nr:archease [Candidatus Binatia bacterium]